MSDKNKNIKWDSIGFTNRVFVDDAVLANINWQMSRLHWMQNETTFGDGDPYKNTGLLNEAKARAKSIIDSINEIDMEAKE